MQFPYWNFFTQGVRFLCFGVVIYITCSIVHRYYLDEDVCLVDFKAIDNELEHIPSFSVCFKDPFLDDEQLIKKFGWNSSHYHGFLKGDHFSVKMQQTEYDEVTIDLLDYVEEVYIEWSNKSYALFDQRTSLDFNSSLNKYLIPSFNGFYGHENSQNHVNSSQNFYKCFELRMPYQAKVFAIHLQSKIFGNETRSLYDFVTFLHHPMQLLLSSSTEKIFLILR